MASFLHETSRTRPEALVRIALAASSYAPHIGGVEEVVARTAAEYQQLGHEVLVITNRWPRDLPRETSIAGVPVRRVSFRLPEGPPRVRMMHALTSRRLHRETQSAIGDFGADVVHVHCVSLNAFYAARAADVLNVPLVTTTHAELTMDSSGVFQRSAFLNRTLRECVEQSQVVTAVSRQSLDDLEAHLAADLSSKSIVIPNGVALDDLRSARPWTHHRPYVLMIGRLTPNKGFDLGLAACASALPSGIDILVVGEGPSRPALEAEARRLAISGRVVFVGAADRPKVAAIYAGARCVLVPSTAEEGLPLVVLEAMAAGRPLIATISGGIPDVARDGAEALLVPRGDLQGFEQAIRTLFADDTLAAGLGAAAASRAGEWDWSNIAPLYIDVYGRARASGRPVPDPR